MFKTVEEKLQKLILNHNVGGHNFKHFISVRDHALESLKYENLSECQKKQVELAALLHDADDYKIFPKSENFENARKILDVSISDTVCGLSKEEFIEGIIDMIALVSCSKNGDKDPPENWMAIPRDCDRLEAIGHIGIKRCREYNDTIGRPFHTKNTPRVDSVEELWKIATPERFEAYQNGAKSESMIDHYYDKLLHIGRPERLKSQNKYILEEAEKRRNFMELYVLDYWKTN